MATRDKAEKGDAGAQNNLGFCYSKGQGVVKDEVEAVHWYRKAAGQNLALAQNNLGLCYAKGEGVAKDEPRSVQKANSYQLLLPLFSLLPARGERLALVSNFGYCGGVFAHSYYPPLNMRIASIIWTKRPDLPGTIYKSVEYSYNAYSPDSPYQLVTYCGEFIYAIYAANTNGPIITTKDPIYEPELQYPFPERFYPIIHPKMEGTTTNLLNEVGIRRSLDGRFWGFDLTEVSPDPQFATSRVNLTAQDITNGLTFNCMAEAKGGEDWLELAANGTVYFREPLAGFSTNQWYEVSVPTNLLVLGANDFDYGLSSAGATNSVVFFALGRTAELPPQFSGIQITNDTVSLNLTNLIPGFTYTVEQKAIAATNWYAATSITLTPDSTPQTVTLPATNATGMFYRIALPQP